jgi:large subunit ribosomal protein L35
MLPHSLTADAKAPSLLFNLFSGLSQMPKLKTHKGIKKRFKLTAKGKLRYKHPGAGHLMDSKNAKRRRRLGGAAILTGVYAENLKNYFGK